MPAPFQYNFEWDPRKAGANLRKHGVSFERAAAIFSDPDALSLHDAEHSIDEDRWITMGLNGLARVLVVCHTWRETAAHEARCRIISARRATRSEARQYWNRKA